MLLPRVAVHELPGIDPKTVIVEASEVYQQEQMDKLGMNVIPCDLRHDAYPFGGGLHCSTADVYRGRVPRLLRNRVEDPTLIAPRDVEVSTTLIVGSRARKAA